MILQVHGRVAFCVQLCTRRRKRFFLNRNIPLAIDGNAQSMIVSIVFSSIFHWRRNLKICVGNSSILLVHQCFPTVRVPIRFTIFSAPARMQPLWAKLVALVLLGVATFVLGLLPMKVKSSPCGQVASQSSHCGFDPPKLRNFILPITPRLVLPSYD